MSHLQAFYYKVSDTSHITKLLTGAMSKENAEKARGAIIGNLIGMPVDNQRLLSKIASRYVEHKAKLDKKNTPKEVDMEDDSMEKLNAFIGQLELITGNKDGLLPSEVVGKVIEAIKRFNENEGIQYVDLKPELNMLLASITIQEIARKPKAAVVIAKDSFDQLNKHLQRESPSGIPYIITANAYDDTNTVKVKGKKYVNPVHQTSVRNNYTYKIKGLIDVYENELPIHEQGISAAVSPEFYASFKKNLSGILEKEDFVDEAFDIIEQASALGRIPASPTFKVYKKYLPEPLTPSELWAELLLAHQNGPEAYRKEIGAASQHINSFTIRPKRIVGVLKKSPEILPLLKMLADKKGETPKNVSTAKAFANRKKPWITELIDGFIDSVYGGNDNKAFEFGPDVSLYKKDRLNVNMNELRAAWNKKNPGIPNDAIIISGEVFAVNNQGYFASFHSKDFIAPEIKAAPEAPKRSIFRRMGF